MMLAKYDQPLVRRRSNGMSDIDRLFDDVLSSWNFFPITHDRIRGIPNHTIEEVDGKLRCDIDLPGVAKGEVDVTVEEDYVMISGKRKEKEFKYRFTIGDTGEFDLDKAEAKLEDGVLSIAIPTIEKPPPRKIKLLG